MAADTRCGLCRYYKPTRNPATGRVLPSKAGDCTWVVAGPLPACINHDGWARKPARGPVWPHSHPDCECFAPLPPQKGTRMTLRKRLLNEAWEAHRGKLELPDGKG